MDETSRKPTTGTRCRTLFDKWHRILYIPRRPRHRHSWSYQGLWLPSHTLWHRHAGHTKAFDYPVTQTQLDIPRPLVTQSQTRLVIPRPLITQSHRQGWTYQGLWLPSNTDTAGHTKAFDYPVTQTGLDIPRPLITQSHRHGWTYQGLIGYPVTETQLDIPRPLITQSHRHGWTYQGLWLPSHTDTAGHTGQDLWLPSHRDTAGHTKAFDYPVMDQGGGSW